MIPPWHFCRKLNEPITWQRLTYRLVKYYRAKAKEGRPPYDPARLLKILLVAYPYNLSKRQVEAVANDRLCIRCFLGLAADHSTLRDAYWRTGSWGLSKNCRLRSYGERKRSASGLALFKLWIACTRWHM